MRWLSILCVLALVPLLTLRALPAPPQAQESAGATDSRGRVGSRAAEVSAARTRGIGPPHPSMPAARPAVTLNGLFGSNSEVIPAAL
jgi:hypothetical protein